LCLAFPFFSGILYVLKVRDATEETKKIMINAPKKPERIFNVTFTDGGSVFIQAMDEAAARRVVEGKSWRENVESEPFTRTVKKIEKVNR
jgi:hypothetical protein